MKSSGKILLAVLLSLFVVVWTSPSEARSGRHYRSHGRNFGHSLRHRSVGIHAGRARHGLGHKRHIGHSNHRHGHKRHIGRSSHRHGHKRHIGRSSHHHGHKRRSSHGRRHHGIGIYLGYGYRSHGYYGHYRYRPYSYYRYPYRYRYYYKPYKTSIYYDDAYLDGYGDYSDDTTVNQGNDLEDGYARGWSLLREDRPAEALQAFGEFAQANPSKGIPKVGYALASAELGRLDKGIWSMRRAIRMDPQALHYVTIDEELRPKVEKLADRYERSPRLSGRDRGDSFMLAALYYLLDDMDAAQEEIKRNRDSDDTSTSAKNLERLIEEKILEIQDQL